MVNILLHGNLRDISSLNFAEEVRFAEVEVGVGGETQGGFTQVEGEGWGVPAGRGEGVSDQRLQRKVFSSSFL